MADFKKFDVKRILEKFYPGCETLEQAMAFERNHPDKENRRESLIRPVKAQIDTEWAIKAKLPPERPIEPKNVTPIEPRRLPYKDDDECPF